MNLPKIKDEEVTGLFEDYFQSYDTISIDDGLIVSYLHKNKLSICPLNIIQPKYMVTNIWTKGILIFKKTYVTIKKL